MNNNNTNDSDVKQAVTPVTPARKQRLLTTEGEEDIVDLQDEGKVEEIETDELSQKKILWQAESQSLWDQSFDRLQAIKNVEEAIEKKKKSLLHIRAEYEERKSKFIDKEPQDFMVIGNLDNVAYQQHLRDNDKGKEAIDNEASHFLPKMEQVLDQTISAARDNLTHKEINFKIQAARKMERMFKIERDARRVPLDNNASTSNSLKNRMFVAAKVGTAEDLRDQVLGTRWTKMKATLFHWWLFSWIRWMCLWVHNSFRRAVVERFKKKFWNKVKAKMEEKKIFPEQDGLRAELAKKLGLNAYQLDIGEECVRFGLFAGALYRSNRTKTDVALLTGLWASGTMRSPFIQESLRLIPVMFSVGKGMLTGSHEIGRAQGEGDLSTLRSGLDGLLNTFGPIFGFKNCKVSKQEFEQMKILSTGLSLGKNIVSVTETALKALWEIVQMVYVRWTGKPWITSDKAVLIEDACDITTRANMWRLSNPDPQKAGALQWKEATDIYQKMGDINNKLLQSQYNVRNFPLFFQGYGRFTEIALQSQNMLNDNRFREEPLFVMFVGSAGVGKTTLMEALVHDILRANQMHYSPAEIFPRKVLNEYWEGYRGQAAIIYDDIFQAQSDEIVEREALEIIYACNTASFPLHMAELASKANTYFTSKIIMATTNDTGYVVQRIKNSDAFNRRRDLVVKVLSGNLDADFYQELRKRDIPDRLAKPAASVRFTLMDRLEQKEIQNFKEITYSQLFSIMNKRFKHKLDENNNVHKILNKLTAPVADMEVEQEMPPDSYFDKIGRAQGHKEREQLKKRAEEVQSEILKEISTGQFSYDEVVRICNDKDYNILERMTLWNRYKSTYPTLQKPVDLPVSEADLGTAEKVKKWLLESPAGDSKASKALVAAGVVLGSVFASYGAYSILKPILEKYLNEDETKAEIEKVGITGTAEVPSAATAEAAKDVYNGPTKVDQKRTKVHTRKPPVKRQVGVAQSVINHAADDVMDLVSKNIINGKVWREDGETSYDMPFRGLAVGGRDILVVTHVVKRLLNSPKSGLYWETMVKGSANHKHRIDVKDIEFVQGQDDYSLIRVNKNTLSEYKDISKHFVMDDDVEVAIRGWGPITLLLKNGDNLEKRVSGTSDLTGSVTYTEDDDEMHTIPRAVKINVSSDGGDCGAPYIINSNAYPRHICGIHVMRKTNGAHATIITQEVIHELRAAMSGVAQGGDTVPVKFVRKVECPPYDNEVLRAKHDIMEYYEDWLEPQGTESRHKDFDPRGSEVVRNDRIKIIAILKPKYTPRMAKTSKIVETALYGSTEWRKFSGPPRTKPAMMNKVGNIDPLQNAYDKWARKRPNQINSDDLEVMDRLALKIASSIPSVGLVKGVLTQKEAFYGVPHQRYLEAIPSITSEGFPLNIQAREEESQGRGKARWWTVETGEIHPSLQELIGMAMLGNRAADVINDFKKDETRPIEKVDAGKTRLIMGGAFGRLIEDRMVWGAFASAVMNNHQSGSCQLGFNPHDRDDVEALLSHLLAVEGCEYAYWDIAGLDCSIIAAIMFVVGKVGRYWYALNDPDWNVSDDMRRVNSTCAAMYSIHVVLDYIFMRGDGNPSGWFLTTVFNSYTVEITTTLCKYRILRDRVPLQISDNNNLKDITPERCLQTQVTKTFGDDSVYKDYLKVCDAKTLQKAMLEICGLELTSPSKKGGVPGTKDITEVVFLQRRPRWDDSTGVWTMVLRKSIIREIPFWQQKGISREDALHNACVAIHMEAYLHGEDFKMKCERALKLATSEIGWHWEVLDSLGFEYLFSRYCGLKLGFGLTDIAIHTTQTPAFVPIPGEAVDPKNMTDFLDQVPMVKALLEQFNVHEEEEEEEGKAQSGEDSPARFGSPDSWHNRWSDPEYDDGIWPYDTDSSEDHYHYVKNGEPVKVRYTKVSESYDDWEERIEYEQQLEEQAMKEREEEDDEIGKAQGSREMLAQSEKSMTEQCANQQIGLTTFEDHVAFEISTSKAISESMRTVDSVRNENVAEVLSRVYTVDWPWTTSMAYDTEVLAWDTPRNNITQFDKIKEILNRAQKFQAGTEFTFRTNGTPMHWGALLISWLPHYNRSDDPVDGWYSTVYNMSCCPSVILTANTDTTVSLTIPYIGPKTMQDLSHISGADQVGCFGYLIARVLVPLKCISSTGSTSITISMATRFVEPRIAGPTNFTLPMMRWRKLPKSELGRQGPLVEPMDKKEEEEYGEAQSGRWAVKKIHDEAPSFVTPGPTIAQMPNDTPSPTPAVTESNVDVKTEEPPMAKIGKYPVKLPSGGNVIQEQQKASKDGMLSGIAEKVADISTAAQILPVVGKYAAAATPVIRSIESFLRWLNLDKPTNITAPGTMLALTTDHLNYGHGTSVTDKIAIDPYNRVSASPHVFGKSREETNYKTIINNPSLFDVITISPTSAPGTIIWQRPVTPAMCHYHYEGSDPNKKAHYHHSTTSLLMLTHRYWSGGMKMYFILECSKFVTGRLRITFLPSAHHVPSDLTDNNGDYWSYVWDFAGPGAVALNFPYVQPYECLESVPYHTVYPTTSNPGFVDANLDKVNGLVAIAIENQMVGSEANADIGASLIVFTSGAEDVQFYSPCDIPQLWKLGDDVIGKAQCGVESTTDIRRIFDREFEPIMPSGAILRHGYAHGESVRDVRSILRRVNYIGNAQADVCINSMDSGSVSSYKTCTATVIPKLFCFARGGERYMVMNTASAAASVSNGYMWASVQEIIPPDSDVSTAQLPADNMSGMGGIVLQHTKQKQVMDFEVPYANTVSFYPTYIGTVDIMWSDEWYHRLAPIVGFVPDKTADPAPTLKVYWAASDDWTASWLRAPPHMLYGPMPPAGKKPSKYPKFRRERSDNNNKKN